MSYDHIVYKISNFYIRYLVCDIKYSILGLRYIKMLKHIKYLICCSRYLISDMRYKISYILLKISNKTCKISQG